MSLPPSAAAAAMCVVLVTAPDEEAASRIADSLVQESLAACVNVVPGIRSVYRWRGAVERASEVLMIVKTRAALLDALERRVSELHPYEVPELVALEPARVAPAYLAWVMESSRSERG